jgi:hypothetical protein
VRKAESTQHRFALGRDAKQGLASVRRTRTPADEASTGRTFHELDSTVVLDLQPLRKGAHGRSASRSKPLERQKELVLLGLHARVASRRFTEVEKMTDLVAQLGKRLQLLIRDRARTQYIVSRYMFDVAEGKHQEAPGIRRAMIVLRFTGIASAAPS